MDESSTAKRGGIQRKGVQGRVCTRPVSIVSRRKRLTHRKKHKTQQPVNQPEELPTDVSSQNSPTIKLSTKDNYIKKSCDPLLVHVQDSLQCQNVSDPVAPFHSLLKKVKDILEVFLLDRWHAIIHLDAIHVVLISAQNNVSVQRSIEFLPNGDVKLFVHCQQVDVEPYVQNVADPVTLSNASVNDFVHRMIQIISNVGQMEMCSGIDSKDLKAGWQSCPLGKIDENPYKESRYLETFRSFSCLGLVRRNAWRCSECAKVVPHLTRRAHSASKEPHPNTPNVHLSEEQKLKKLEEQRELLEIQRKKIARLEQGHCTGTVHILEEQLHNCLS